MQTTLTMDMSEDKKVFQTLVKPALVGASAYFISQMMFGNTDMVTLPFIKTRVSLPMFYALMEGGISYLTEPVAMWVLPYISSNSEKTMTWLNPAIHAGLSYVGLSQLYPSILKTYGTVNACGVGALSEFTGQYLNTFALQYM